jgi:hypothetical protein
MSPTKLSKKPTQPPGRTALADHKGACLSKRLVYSWHDDHASCWSGGHAADADRNDRYVLTEEPAMGIFSRFSSRRSADKPDRLRRWVAPPSGNADPELDETKAAAAADVAEMQKEDRKYFRPDGPGEQEDDL